MRQSSIKRTEVNGILLLDKSPDMTSNTALQKCKRLFNARKAGHGGTLDEAAEGALPIMFGHYTKLAGYFLNSYKIYECKFKLGATTDTGDAQGTILEEKPIPQLNKEKLDACLEKFRGLIVQRPPIYSALKYMGKRMHEYARKGEDVPIKLRTVDIRTLELLDMDEDNSTLKLRVECSKGTYIRSMAVDIGKELGCGAHVNWLRRTHLEGIPSKYMVTLTELTEQPLEQRNDFLVNSQEILTDITSIFISSDEASDFCHGRVVTHKEDISAGEVCVFLKGYDEDGDVAVNSKLLGIGEWANNQLQPRRIFCATTNPPAASDTPSDTPSDAPSNAPGNTPGNNNAGDSVMSVV